MRQIHDKSEGRSTADLATGVVLCGLVALFLLQIDGRPDRPDHPDVPSLIPERQPGIQIRGDRREGNVIVVNGIGRDCPACDEMWKRLAAYERTGSPGGPALHVLPVPLDHGGAEELMGWVCASIEQRFWALVRLQTSGTGSPERAARLGGVANVPEFLACLEDGRMRPVVASFDSAAVALDIHGGLVLPTLFIGGEPTPFASLDIAAALAGAAAMAEITPTP